MLESKSRIYYKNILCAITQVPGVGDIVDVPVKIVLGAEAHWPVSTSHIVRACTLTKTYSSTCLFLQTRSMVAIRCVTWMQQWVSQPLITSVSRNHKCGFNRAGLEVEQAVLQYLPAFTHTTAETAAANYNCHRSAPATQAGAPVNRRNSFKLSLSNSRVNTRSRGQSNKINLVHSDISGHNVQNTVIPSYKAVMLSSPIISCKSNVAKK